MPIHHTGAHQLQALGGGCTCDASFERSAAYGTSFGICNQSTTTAVWICRADDTIADNDTVYTSSGCTSAYDGGGDWHVLSDGNKSYGCTISSTGEIENLAACP